MERSYRKVKRMLAVGPLLLVAALATGDIIAQQSGGGADRQRALAMFARSYYPGRSGQIMIVPREGSIVIERTEPLVRFMHGSPWPYDTRIPLLFHGPSIVRPGVYKSSARQQDVTPTIAHVL